jgi:hypothetical protein
MDYSSFYPQQYSTLTAENLQAANNAFAVNGLINNAPAPNNGQPANNVAQLQQNMFYLDPFDHNGKVESNDYEQGSHSSECPCCVFDNR